MDRIDARHSLRVLWPQLALWAVLCTLVAGVTVWLIETSRQRELNDGRVEAENLAGILQDQTARTFAGADVALSMLKALHERGVGDAVLAPVAESLARTPTSEVERIFSRFDAEGRLAASSVRDAPIGRISIADRPYFAEARDAAGPGLHVSAPLLSRFRGAEVIPIAKRLNRPDGTFDGVVTMMLDPARLLALFRSLHIGEASSIGLMHRDGRVYVASGVARPPGGADADASPTAGEGAGSPGTTLAALAGESSIVATSPIPGTDIVAFAALSEEALLTNHRVVARSLLGYAALIVLALTMPIALASKRAIIDARRRRALELRYEDARERARTDPLTGLANRDAFDSQLRASHKAAGDGVPFVLAFLDIDRFKALNDRHGHDTGDRALKRVADAMAGNVRRTDVVARMGGDEFAVLMPGADHASCLRVFDNLRETLRLVTLEEGWPISFSIGVVAFESAPARARDAIAMADRLMYDVKGSGRDGTRFATFRQGRLVVDATKEPIAA